MKPNSEQTQELLDRAKGGDTRAVDRLLALHREPLRRMISLRLDPALAARLDASDVVQEVQLEASKRLDDYLRNPSMPFHLWLRYIAGDHIKDAHRRHRKAQRRSVDRERQMQRPAAFDQSSLELAAQLIDPEKTPATAAMLHEAARRAEAALADLDNADREIILMRNYEHLSNKEAATMLGISEEAASMRYLRAARRLAAMLQPAEPDA